MYATYSQSRRADGKTAPLAKERNDQETEDVRIGCARANEASEFTDSRFVLYIRPRCEYVIPDLMDIVCSAMCGDERVPANFAREEVRRVAAQTKRQMSREQHDTHLLCHIQEKRNALREQIRSYSAHIHKVCMAHVVDIAKDVKDLTSFFAGKTGKSQRSSFEMALQAIKTRRLVPISRPAELERVTSEVRVALSNLRGTLTSRDLEKLAKVCLPALVLEAEAVNILHFCEGCASFFPSKRVRFDLNTE